MSPLPFLCLFLLSSPLSVYGVTHNCINKTYPSSACCSGEITLPPTITTIGTNAFSSCSGLTGSLTIPSSVTSIGTNAFGGCSGFTGSLVIPSSVVSIGNGAFYGCSGFTGSLSIPSSVTSISQHAFAVCRGLTGFLTIPSSVTFIGHGAFDSSGLTGPLSIPSSVTSIGGWAFNGCSGFTGSLTIPSSVTSIEVNAFSGCSGFTGSLTIPSSVTSIGTDAFRGCSGFTGSLAIPSSVSSIGNGAFYGCSAFSRAITFPNSVSLGSDVFFNNVCNWISCCSNCVLTGAAMCICDSSPCIGVCSDTFFPTFQPTFHPSRLPTLPPSLNPTRIPTVEPTTSTNPTILPSVDSSSPEPTLFSFSVRVGDGIHSSRKSILVNYLQDLNGGMTPISGLVDPSLVSSDSDPQLSSDSILIKWRPVAAAGMESWETNNSGNYTITIPGGVFVFWLVSLSSDGIMGFIVQGQLGLPSLFYPPSLVISDPNTSSSTYLIYFIHYPSSSRRLSLPSSSQGNRSGPHRFLTISDPGISISISPNKTLSSRTISSYVTGVSDKRFYLLGSGWRR